APPAAGHAPAPSLARPGASSASARPLLVAALVPLLLAGCAAAGSSAPGPGSGVPAATATGTPDAWAWHMPQCVGYDQAAYRAPSHRVAVTSHGAPVREVYE